MTPPPFKEAEDRPKWFAVVGLHGEVFVPEAAGFFGVEERNSPEDIA
jgi:aminoglycoside phosphotransferase (APT) family kinase protein